MSLAQRRPNQNWSTVALECQAHGLSVFENPAHAQRVRKRVRRFRKHMLGIGELLPEHGVSKPTSSQFGNSHRTWWPVEGLHVWEMFQLVEENTDAT